MKNHANVLGSYLMSFNTYYVEPFIHENQVFSRVIDKHNEVIVAKKPIQIVRKSCSFLGTTYEATRLLSKEFFGNQHKLPIILTHDFGIPCVFIPTCSPKSDMNAWIGLHAIEQALPFKNGTKVLLKNGEELEISTQFNSFSKQYTNGTMLHKHYSKIRKSMLEGSFVQM